MLVKMPFSFCLGRWGGGGGGGQMLCVCEKRGWGGFDACRVGIQGG